MKIKIYLLSTIILLSVKWLEAQPYGFGNWGDCHLNALLTDYQAVCDTSFTFEKQGSSVDIFGDYAVVGIPFDTIGSQPQKGSVQIYYNNNGIWNAFQKLTDLGGNSYHNFGFSVKLDSQYLVVGAPNANAGSNVNRGAVIVFKLVNGLWVQQQKLTDVISQALDRFGHSVDINKDRIIVGAPNVDVSGFNNAGSIFIFKNSNSNWILESEIPSNTPIVNAQLGFSVAINNQFAIAGAPNDFIGGNANQGSASIYSLVNNIWTFYSKITRPSGLPNENFGYSLDISTNSIVIGIPHFTFAGLTNLGLASVFYKNENVWAFRQYLNLPDGASGDEFGSCVSINNNYILVGGPKSNKASSADRGQISIFNRVGFTYLLHSSFYDPGGFKLEQFGYQVGLNPISKTFITSSPFFDKGRGKIIFGKIK